MIFKERTCSYCKSRYTPTKPKQKVCSAKCAIGLGEKQKSKALASQQRMERKELREKKLAIKSRSEWMKDAQFWFNKFIRIRDGNNPCISCGRWHTGQYHAGHYRSVGSAPHLRFNENNCHKQCSVCNNHLSGNLLQYRAGIIQKLGAETVERLMSDNTPKHYSIDDLKEIKAIYQAKVKQLESR